MTDEISTELFNASDVETEVSAQLEMKKVVMLNRREALLMAARRADGNIEAINAELTFIDENLKELG